MKKTMDEDDDDNGDDKDKDGSKNVKIPQETYICVYRYVRGHGPTCTQMRKYGEDTFVR